jgi:hypothetical protein
MASLITLFLIIMLLTYIRLHKEYDSNPFLQGDINYLLKDLDLEVKTSRSQSSVAWYEVVKVKQSPKIVAVYISKSQAYIIPKQLLSSEQKETLHILLKSRLDSKKYPYSKIE